VSGLASVSERARDVADLEGQSKHAMAVAAVATAAEGDDVSASAVEVVAAVMIQATYRGYLVSSKSTNSFRTHSIEIWAKFERICGMC
jgi:cation transport ATPase